MILLKQSQEASKIPCTAQHRGSEISFIILHTDGEVLKGTISHTLPMSMCAHMHDCANVYTHSGS